MLIFISSKGLSQKGSYRIINKNKTHNISEYKDAIEKADFNRMRFKNKRRKLVFENGPTIELFSAQELIDKGYNIDINEAIDNDELINEYNIWKLSPNGHVIQVIAMDKKINIKK